MKTAFGMIFKRYCCPQISDALIHHGNTQQKLPTSLSSHRGSTGYHSVEENEDMRKSSANQKLSTLDMTEYKFASNHSLGPDVISSSWAGIGAFKRDWGYLGPPVALRILYEGADGVMTVLPRLDNGGLEILVSLGAGAMERLLVDGKFGEVAKVGV